MKHVRLEQPVKSAVMEHSITLQEYFVLRKAAAYRDRLAKEAVEIRLNTRNLNRGGGLNLRRA
jgi:hypothetical protein